MGTVQKRTKLICNGKTYYHYEPLDPKEPGWTHIYDSNRNFILVESERLPIKAISLMLKAYQRGLLHGRQSKFRLKVSSLIFRYRLKRNIRKDNRNNQAEGG